MNISIVRIKPDHCIIHKNGHLLLIHDTMSA